jgi:hypothetical protein
LLEFAEQGKRFIVSLQLAQDLIGIAERKRRETYRKFTRLGEREESVGLFGERLAIREMIQRHIRIEENFNPGRHVAFAIRPSTQCVHRSLAAV